MAKATKVIHQMEIDPEVKHEQELRDLEELLLENKDVLHDIFAILDKLRHRELFNMINGGLGQSEQVLHRIVTALDDPETTQSMKNVLLLFELLGTVNMNELEPLVLKINSGIAKAAEYEHENKRGGYAGLFGAIKDPEVIEGMNVLIKLVKGMGVNEDNKEKIEPQLERFEHPEKEMQEMDYQVKGTRSLTSGSSQKWYAFVAGAAVLLIPFLMKRK